ncbi:MAG: hypothetical protein N2689_07095, partial [Verrucomicrobiae bacterium]|nr:hypothetical protein [Verrucomicrobiae bacterium]
MIRWCVVLLAVVPLWAQTLLGGPNTAPPGDAVLRLLDARVLSLKSWQANFTKLAMEGTNAITQSGTVRFARQPTGPGQLAVEKGRADFLMQMKGREMNYCIVSGADSIVWQVISDGNARQILRFDLNRPIPRVTQNLRTLNPINAVNPLSLLQQIRGHFDFTLQGIEELGGRRFYQLAGKLKPGVQSPVSLARLRIGMEDSFLHRIILCDAHGNPALDMNLAGVRFNLDLEDALFVYAPPAGANVIDFNA